MARGPVDRLLPRKAPPPVAYAGGGNLRRSGVDRRRGVQRNSNV